MRLVQVSQLPKCQWCEFRPAKVEGPTHFGCHMSLCGKCHELHGVQGSSIAVELTTEPVNIGGYSETVVDLAEELGITPDEAAVMLGSA